MAIVNFTPSKSYPKFASQVFQNKAATSYPDSATVAVGELLGGILIETKNGAATLTLPTAAQINAAIPGPTVGDSFEFYVRNTGNNTTTVAVGTGITSVSGNTLTVATVNTRLFVLRCTGVASQGVVGSSDSYDLYSLGVSAH